MAALDKSRNLSKIVSVLRSASVERFDVSRMRDFFFYKLKSGHRELFFLMLGALTQHAWHAKSQSAATSRKGAMRVFAATTPSLILCPHPLLSVKSI